MKKTKSLFLKICLVMLPVVLLLNLIVLTLSYNITYESNFSNSETRLRKATKEIAEYLEYYNMNDIADKLQREISLDDFCEMLGVTYIFVVDVDVEKRDETYLAIGFGEDASLEAMETRYAGLTVEGTLTDEEIEAFNGNTEGVIAHEKNQFGDTLICYAPCIWYFDTTEYEYFKYKKPVVVGVEMSLDSVNRSFQERYTIIAILTISVTVLMLIVFVVIMYLKIARPIRKISGRMSSFITDREKGVEKLSVKGNDELALMAYSFNTMSDEINSYIDDIDALNREKHTQEAELNIARRIQMGLLQPAAFDGDSADIRAYMLPAKDVGGDLYDYRILDDGRIFAAVADVSGKGIFAALFMSRAITLLHQYAQMKLTPSQMLAEFNNTLSAQNPGGLFITAFVAVFDPVFGELVYSNAGHNIPYILSDSLIRLEDAHGVASGIFEGEEYEDAVVTLKPGDCLFLYTDGVNEAKDKDENFYSTERLEEKLRSCIASGSTEILAEIKSDLTDFTHGAVQNDDITMLTMRVCQQPTGIILRLTSEREQLRVIRDAIRGLDADEDMKNKLYLAAEEMFINICSYAYDTPGEVGLRIAPGARTEMTFTDGGKPFDPTKELLDIEEYDHDNSIGGLGRFLTFSIADDYEYKYLNGKNTLTLYFDRGDVNESNKDA